MPEMSMAKVVSSVSEQTDLISSFESLGISGPKEIKNIQPSDLENIVSRIDEQRTSLESITELTEFNKGELSEYLNLVKKHHKTHPYLQNREAFNKLQSILTSAANSTKAAKISIDVEAYEMNQSIITEIGLSIYDPFKQPPPCFESKPGYPPAQSPYIIDIHIIISENIHLRNGLYVEDNKSRFLFGNSLILTTPESKKLIQCVFDHYFQHRKAKYGNDFDAVLVGHGIKGDIKWLQGFGIKLPNVLVLKSIDTQILCGLPIAGKGLPPSLIKSLQRYDIHNRYLHNAGNDAHFTLILLLKLLDLPSRVKYRIDLPNTIPVEERKRFEAGQLQKFEFNRARGPGYPDSGLVDSLPVLNSKNFTGYYGYEEALKWVFGA
ncbi:hypothetical protein WICPIJ_006550 [Wickerhamomyces pijperi]|uniref:Gfd2/YDR514C-like C-terminal domain-containing protein n=1 Tax=Wickerhamomyces pijperi TaxID=599730 RepID=A0A9P8Q1F3_WICPI|nr:hypothetical protein WICPIJ_006550 [Wickerhamomyces pijperi]